MKVVFTEPIFYFDGDSSSFIEADHISTDGIYVSADLQNKTRLNKLRIEFSFPKSDYIVKATTTLESSGLNLFLKFETIDKKSISQIQNFISQNSKKIPASAIQVGA